MAKKPQLKKTPEMYEITITGPSGYNYDKLQGAIILAVEPLSREAGKNVIYSIGGHAYIPAK